MGDLGLYDAVVHAAAVMQGLVTAGVPMSRARGEAPLYHHRGED